MNSDTMYYLAEQLSRALSELETLRMELLNALEADKSGLPDDPAHSALVTGGVD